MKVSVLGCGRWGTFLGWYSDKIGHNVTIWGRSGSKNLEELEHTRKNKYLYLSETTKLTNDLDATIDNSDYIIISISSQHLRNLCEDIKKSNYENKTFILCMKGIEVSTGKRLTEVFREILGSKVKLAVWVGPGHVQSFVKRIPNCMVIDSDNKDVTEDVVKTFSSDLIRLYIGEDLIGDELGAAAKNVIGIAAGMLDAVGYSSLKGALMARGAREVSRLIKAMGGDEITAYGLCHLGDYEATLFSEFSNNRRYGENFVRGTLNDDYLAEGVSTAKAIVKLSDDYNVEMPIIRGVDAVLNGELSPHKMLKDMFLRSVKKEFY
ncbi:putative glycerol-3-phosphate dehydrogenase [NAD(P)+] [Anaerofustis stercorihominis DSM 17244]|uniref:Glycerol-3-phosphate dehydrogenase n=1 Tax=Anaerofustis stercorihominis DSM 17244 TaxID=445971 RepID=B1CBI2_9FIRM|nr:NAD(P)H-dependent glycerol-3-phosphate dehydrogenase [Anaerofustis stercorihominis]EDS71629.1 putative glycerol-3-phosphate dehydrogenase [NAD(P)+] [Anaerofustis stercorihominis DSM 17244]